MTIPIQFFAKPILFLNCNEKAPARDRRAGLPKRKERIADSEVGRARHGQVEILDHGVHRAQERLFTR